MFGYISRYILRSHVAPFIFGFSTVVFIFLMQFLMNYLNQLVGKGLSEWVILQLIVYNIAWMVILAVPMGVLFSTLMAFGSLSANHEITIVKASGGSLIKMMVPVVIMASLITYGLFLFNDIILPESNHRAKVMMNDIKRKKPTFNLESGKFSTDIEGYTIIAREVDSLTGNLYGVTIYDHKQPKLRNVISADSGYVKFEPNMEKMILTLLNGEVHQMELSNPRDYKIINYNEYVISMNASGFSFDRTEEGVISRGDREMRIQDMQVIVDESSSSRDKADSNLVVLINNHFDYLLGIEKELISSEVDNTIDIAEFTPNAKVKDSTDALQNAEKRMNFLRANVRTNYSQYNQHKKRARQYEVEIQKKYAIPFACVLFVFVGCPLGIMTRKGNFGISAGISLVFYIFYWACLIGGEKLADRGILDPTVSMWLGNGIIAFLGIMLTLKVNYETFNFFRIFASFFKK